MAKKSDLAPGQEKFWRLRDDIAARKAAAVEDYARELAWRSKDMAKAPTLAPIWIAYYPDFSDIVPFDSEVAAPRYAVEQGGMWVKSVSFGESVKK